MSVGPRSYLAEVLGAVPLPPPSPPRPPTLVGPDKWWNPFAPSWPTTALGRAAYEAARNKSAQVAQDIERRTEQMRDLVPDPIIAAETVIGRPTWGYYVPTVAAGTLAVGALALVGGLVYKHRKKRA